MPVSSGHRCILSDQLAPETFSDLTRFCGLRHLAQKIDTPCPYQNLVTRSHTRGLVAVSSGRVTVEDMERADEAATNDLLPPKSHALYRRRLYFELNPNCSLEIWADFWQTTKAMDCGGLVVRVLMDIIMDILFYHWVTENGAI